MSEGLITTVRERYGHAVSYRGLFTLAYREQSARKSGGAAKIDEISKRGLFGLLLPQLQSVSKRIHDEVNKLLERREKLLLKTVSKNVPQIIGRNTEPFFSESQKLVKTQADKTLRLEKRVDLINADIGARLKAMQKELERHKAEEEKRLREQTRLERERSIKARDIRQRENREDEREREEMLRDIGIDMRKAERRITRKLRDDEEYEKRRRG